MIVEFTHFTYDADQQEEVEKLGIGKVEKEPSRVVIDMNEVSCFYESYCKINGGRAEGTLVDVKSGMDFNILCSFTDFKSIFTYNKINKPKFEKIHRLSEALKLVQNA